MCPVAKKYALKIEEDGVLTIVWPFERGEDMFAPGSLARSRLSLRLFIVFYFRYIHE